MGSSVAIVIPCYNEAKRLKVSQFENTPMPIVHLFMFVNDGSNDATLKVIQGLHQDHPQRCHILICRGISAARPKL